MVNFWTESNDFVILETWKISLSKKFLFEDNEGRQALPEFIIGRDCPLPT